MRLSFILRLMIALLVYYVTDLTLSLALSLAFWLVAIPCDTLCILQR